MKKEDKTSHRSRHGRGIIVAALLLAAIVYVSVGAVVYCLQDSLVFRPSIYPPGKLDRRAKKARFERWIDGNGEFLGWKSVDGDPQKPILGLHAQGGGALDLSFLRTFARESGNDLKIYLLEYPGYGERPGVSSEESLTTSAIAALDLLSSSPNKPLIVGQSLGTGVACAAIRFRPSSAAGLVLLTPFSSFSETAAQHYPYYPISLLLRTRFDSTANLAGYRGPVAFVICEKDTKIPVAQARKFYKSFAGTKRLWLEPSADHDPTSLLRSEWPVLMDWLATNPPPPLDSSGNTHEAR